MVLEWLFASLGILYGYQKPGVEDPKALFMTGARVGIVLAFVAGILAAIVNPLGPLPLSFGLGFVGTVFGVAYYTIIFTTGAVIGDFLEIGVKK
ncbi:MAG: hypothetical protein ACE5PM_01620 [Candidatus Hydrothermarchaeales archaeon]